MRLVIVESPTKAKTIEKYLGKGYKVKASKGHVVDLPKSEMGIDFDKDYQPKYVVTKKAALKQLKDAFKGAEELVIATDLDREGEAIGWHIAQKLGVIDKHGKEKKDYKGKVKRIVFTEITKDAIKNAIESPRNIDMDLVNAQEARRLLDRIVGYKLSPLLWKKIRYGLSAGRVQSVALRLIVEREEERGKFNPEEYWSIDSLLADKKGKLKIEYLKKDGDEDVDRAEEDDSLYKFSLNKVDGNKPELSDESQVKKIIEEVKEEDWKISSMSTRESRRNPKPPFITSTLQRTSSSWFGYSAKRTMQIAQKLYEKGLITYMRTDSTNIADSALKNIRTHIDKNFGKEYLPAKANIYSKKARGAQEAHESIRPSDVKKTPENIDLDGDELKLYRLIWQRTVGSQMSPAIINTHKIEIPVKKYVFSSSVQTVKFKGYLDVYPEKVTNKKLPDLSEGQSLYPRVLTGEQHFTQPPPRYTEASLIKKLEEEGIGRPSTYASIISTIQTRRYVEKENAAFLPTDTGVVVNHLLVDNFMSIVDYKFTANLESSLDNVAEGNLEWVKMLDDFYKPFEKNIETQEENIKREDYTVLGDAPKDIKCPECSKPMKIKLGRYGRFYSCSNWPDCKGILNIDGTSEADMLNKPKTKEFQENYEPAPKTDDGRDYILKRGRYGEFWAHPDYPKVKDAKPLELKPEKMKEVYGEIPKTEDGRNYLLKKGRFGEFWAHPDYPKVKDIKKISKKS